MTTSRLTPAGKHIEIQIFGDSSGNCISLYERECSIQRRHQKVIEEAPSPYITPQLRAKMSAAATELGRLLKYEGAGTVEFIVDVKTGGFYFLEVNTRVQVVHHLKSCLIQVEHPITEETTLVDIVALQIYVASGGLLNDLPYLLNLKQHVTAPSQISNVRATQLNFGYAPKILQTTFSPVQEQSAASPPSTKHYPHKSLTFAMKLESTREVTYPCTLTL